MHLRLASISLKKSMRLVPLMPRRLKLCKTTRLTVDNYLQPRCCMRYFSDNTPKVATTEAELDNNKDTNEDVMRKRLLFRWYETEIFDTYEFLRLAFNTF